MTTTLITAANSEYKEAWKVLHAFAKAYGWNESVGDLGGLGMGVDYSGYDLSKWAHKPELLYRESVAKGIDKCLYLDCDAFPVFPVDHVWQMMENLDANIAVTVRPQNALAKKSGDAAQFMGWTNAGVMFVRSSAATNGFLHTWCDKTKDSNDQQALNEMLHPDSERPDDYQVITRHGARVLMLPEVLYNYGGDLAVMSGHTKILHLKGKRWKNHLKTLRAWAGMNEPSMPM